MTFSKNFITMTINFLSFIIKSFSSLVIKAFWVYPRSHVRILHKLYSNHLMMMSENTHSWKCAFTKHNEVLLSFEKYISTLLNERMPLSSKAFIFLLILVLILKFWYLCLISDKRTSTIFKTVYYLVLIKSVENGLIDSLLYLVAKIIPFFSFLKVKRNVPNY